VCIHINGTLKGKVTHTEKLSPSLAALLLLSTVMLATPTSAKPAPPGEGVIWLEPDCVNGSAVGGLGSTFIVELRVNISVTAGPPGGPYGCFAYAYWLSWNDTLLNLTSYSVFPPTDIWTSGIFTAEDLKKDTDLNNKSDIHSYSVTALGTPPGFTGARKIAEYTFIIAYQPIDPESNMSCVLDITEKGFVDANEDPIPMAAYDGLYVISPAPRTRDVGIVSVKSLRSIIGLGYILPINVSIVNYGVYTESFNVTVYANATAIQTLNVTNLQPRNSITLTFTWNTTGFAKGNYNVSAYAWPVPDETHTEDNTCIYGTIRVSMEGDVGPEWGIVDIFDVRRVAKAYGSAAVDDPETPWDETKYWNPNVDLAPAPYGDGKIDILDVRKCAKHYGETDS